MSLAFLRTFQASFINILIMTNLSTEAASLQYQSAFIWLFRGISYNFVKYGTERWLSLAFPNDSSQTSKALHFSFNFLHLHSFLNACVYVHVHVCRYMRSQRTNSGVNLRRLSTTSMAWSYPFAKPLPSPVLYYQSLAQTLLGIYIMHGRISCKVSLNDMWHEFTEPLLSY